MDRPTSAAPVSTSACAANRNPVGATGKNHKFSEISLENEILRKVFSKKMVF
jgi:hypothetical protein